MTFPDELRDHQGRCQPYVLKLRMLACGEVGAALPRQVTSEIAQATRAIIGEAEAAGRAALDTVTDRGGEPESGTFLRVRLNRLAATADEAITAARGGDMAGLSRHLRRFDALTSAIWAVQHAVYGRVPRQQPAEPARGRPSPASAGS